MLTKTEIAHEIRSSLEGLPCPICTKDVPDNVLVILNNVLDDMVQEHFCAEMDFENEKMSSFWWGNLERLALDFGMEYYSEMED